MDVNVVKIYSGLPNTGAAQTVYTNPTTTPATVTKIGTIALTNQTGSAATVTVQIGATNKLINAYSVAANDHVVLDYADLYIDGVDTIQVTQGTASAIFVNIGGKQVINA